MLIESGGFNVEHSGELESVKGPVDAGGKITCLHCGQNFLLTSIIGHLKKQHGIIAGSDWLCHKDCNMQGNINKTIKKGGKVRAEANKFQRAWAKKAARERAMNSEESDAAEMKVAASSDSEDPPEKSNKGPKTPKRVWSQGCSATASSSTTKGVKKRRTAPAPEADAREVHLCFTSFPTDPITIQASTHSCNIVLMLCAPTQTLYRDSFCTSFLYARWTKKEKKKKEKKKKIANVTSDK